MRRQSSPKITQLITIMARPLSRNGNVAGRKTGSRGSLSTIPTIERSAKEQERGEGGESSQTTRQILGGYDGWCDLREHSHFCFTLFLET